MKDHKRIAMLDSGANMIYEARESALNFSHIDQYDLPGTDLSPYCCLIIGGSIDQELLLKHRDKIRAFLDDGKILIFGGHLFRPWLPGGSDFIPRAIHHHTDYHINIVQEEPFFHGVDPMEITYRKGVAGFFARGHHPMPEGAIPLLALPGGEPVLYLDRVSTRGTLLVGSGATLLGFSQFSNSTRPITDRLLAWIYEEAERLPAGQRKEAY